MRRLWDISLRAMFDALGLGREPTGTAEALVRELGVAPRHEWLVRRWLVTLAQERVLELRGEEFRVVRAPSGGAAADHAAICAELRFPAEMAVFHRSAMEHLPEVLRDEVPIGRLVPRGRRTSLLPDSFNVFTAELDEAIAEFAWLAATRAEVRRRQLRIVELGGGVGRTASIVCNELAHGLTSYCFTDASIDLVCAAPACTPVVASVVDFDKDFAEQGLEPGSAEVVITSNALHHAQDVPATLAWIRELLTEDGELLLGVHTGDDRAALVSSHFFQSPQDGGPVVRDGDVFPDEGFWLNALRSADLVPVAVLAAREPGCARGVGYRLFRAMPRG